MTAAVSLCVIVTLALANGAPHGFIPHNLAILDQSLTSEEITRPVAYGYRVRTSHVDHALPISVSEGHFGGAFGYKVKSADPVLVHAPVSGGIAVSPVVGGPVSVSFKQTTEGEKVEKSGDGSFSYSYESVAPAAVGVAHSRIINAQVPAIAVASAATIHPGPVSVTYERTAHHSGKKVEGEGSFAYSYHADSPVVAPVPVPVVGAPIGVAVKTTGVESVKSGGDSGAFSYSVTADAPFVSHGAYLASAPVGISYEQAVLNYGDKDSGKGSGSFGYAYNAEAPVFHHSVVESHAIPFAHTSTVVQADDTVEVGGKSGAFGYSVTADAPLVGAVPVVATAPAAVSYEHVDSKSVDVSADDKSSGSFSYSYSAEAPVVAPVLHQQIIAAPVAYHSSIVSTGESAEIAGRSGAFSYSVTADAPVVSHGAYVASVPAGASYDQTVVNYGEKISGKSSGSFSYSYNAEAPVVAPVVHHSVVASHAVPYGQTSTVVQGDDSVEVGGPSRAFSYSVTADAPLVGAAHVVAAAPAAVSYDHVDSKSVDVSADDKSSGSFAYSFQADAPVVSSVLHRPIVVAPIGYSGSVVKSDDSVEVGSRSGSFAYSVTADAPLVGSAHVFASAPEAVSEEQIDYKSVGVSAEDKPSGAFSYSFNAEAPVVAPVAHHSVVAAHAVPVYHTSTIVSSDNSVEVGGPSGAFAYSLTADAPLVGSAHVVAAAPAAVSYEQGDAKSVDVSAEDKTSGSFAYSFNAEAPVVAPVVHQHVVAAPVAYHGTIVNTEGYAEGAEKSGAFSYSVTADAPAVSHGAYFASAPVGISYEQAVVNYGDKISDKNSGSFSYSYNAEAPVVSPLVHHSVVASHAVPVTQTSTIVSNDDSVEVGGISGAYDYSVNADEPQFGAAPAAVSYERVDSKSADASTGDKSSGSFSYSFDADSPVVAPVVHQAAVVTPVAVSFKESSERREDGADVSGQSGVFSYSYQAEAPVAVAHTYAAAPVALAAYQGEGGAVVDNFAYGYNAVAAPVGAISAHIASDDAAFGYYINSGASISDLEREDVVAAKEAAFQSIGYHGAFGARTAPVQTVVTGYEHGPIGYAGYGVPITIKCD